jgi:hypothetical protein
MNLSNLQDNEESPGSQIKVWIAALGTGILFWTSLFGLIFFCLRA